MHRLRATHRIGLGLLAVLLASALYRGHCLAADEAPPAPPAARQFAPVAVIAVRSVDAVAGTTRQLGLPFELTPEMVEMQALVVPKGSLATDKPVGVILFGGPAAGPPATRTFVFPVKPGAATAEALKAAGAEPVPGQADTLKLHEMYLRRTADHLIAALQPELPALVKPEIIADTLKGPDTLVRVVVDLKTMRTVMPEQFEAMLAGMQGMAQGGGLGGPSTEPSGAGPATGPTTAPGASGASAGAGPVLGMGANAVADRIRKLDRVELELGNPKEGLRLAVTAAPVRLPEGEAGKLPGLPAGVIARVDVAGPVVRAIPNDENWAKSIVEGGGKDGKGAAAGPELTPEQKVGAEKLLVQARALLLGDGGMTAGIEMFGSSPVVYLVNRYAAPVDLATRLPQLVGRLNAMAAGANKPAPLDLLTYSVGPTRVLRVVVMDHGNPVGYLDAVQSGDAVLMAASDKPFRCIDRLVDAQGAAGSGAPEAGAARGLAGGWLDLGALASAASRAAASPLSGMPADQRKQLLGLLQGQRLSVSASTEGDAATFDLTVPTGLLQNVPKLVQMFGPGPGGPGGPETGPSPTTAPGPATGPGAAGGPENK